MMLWFYFEITISKSENLFLLLAALHVTLPNLYLAGLVVDHPLNDTLCLTGVIGNC